MPKIKREISEVVTELRDWQRREKLSQAEIAERLNVGQPTVSKLLKGQLPDAPSFHKLCTVAGITVHKPVEPWSSAILTQAVGETWDGSDEGAQAIALLLLAARRISSPVEPESLPA